MGIGTDAAKQLIASVAGSPTARSEIADAVNKLNEALVAIDLGEVDAKHVLAQENSAAFEVVRARVVAEKLADLDKPKEEPRPTELEAAVEAEAAKR